VIQARRELGEIDLVVRIVDEKRRAEPGASKSGVIGDFVRSERFLDQFVLHDRPDWKAAADRPHGQRRVELLVQVVRGAGGDGRVRLQVERDSDSHGCLLAKTQRVSTG